MRAGVPVKRPVAGVAMGLMLEAGGEFVVLTDILGSEDALGDMDFKVAGDAEGITAFQMDIKVPAPRARARRQARPPCRAPPPLPRVLGRLCAVRVVLPKENRSHTKKGIF